MRKTFSKKVKDILFSNLEEIPNQDKNQFRKDRKGRKIFKGSYGDRNSSMGWNIHHKDKNPKNNNINNLEALNFISHNEEHKNN